MGLFHKRHSEKSQPKTTLNPSPKLIDDISKAAKWAESSLNTTGYKADGSIESIREIDRFISEQLKPGGVLDGKMGHILFGLASYVGQVVIENYGGEWIADDDDPDGEINIEVKLANGDRIWPVVRLMKRIKEGPENAIYPYALAAGKDERLREVGVDNLGKIGRGG